MHKTINDKNWNELYNDFLVSKQSIRKWCKINNIKVHSFYYFRKKNNVLKKSSNIFTKVNIQSNVHLESSLSIKYPNGVIVDVSDNTSIDLINKINMAFSNND